MKNNIKSGLAINASKLSFSNVLSLSINMLTIMLLSRFISQLEYGTYSQITIINTLAISIFSLGLPNCINFFFARAESDSEKYFFLKAYFLSITIIFLLVAILLFALSPYIVFYFNNNLLYKYTIIFATLPLMSIVIQSNSHLLISIGKSNKLIILTLINNVSLLLSIISVRIFNLSFTIYIILYITTQAVYSGYVYIFICKLTKSYSSTNNTNLNTNNILAYLKNMLQFSIPLGLGSMVSTLSIELDKLVIGRLMDTSSLAVYTNASKELPLTIIVSSFTAILLPKLSRMYKHKDINGIINVWHSSICIGFTVMIFFTTSIITFAPQALAFLYSEKYLSGLGVFIICTCILLLRSTYFGIILNITGNTKYVFYSSIFALILNFISNFIFFKIFGFIGPAISTILCIIAINTLQLRYTSRILNISFCKIFPWIELGKILLKNIIIAPIFIIASSLIKLGTDIKSILIAIIISIIWLFVHLLANKKYLLAKWNFLNRYSIEE